MPQFLRFKQFFWAIHKTGLFQLSYLTWLPHLVVKSVNRSLEKSKTFSQEHSTFHNKHAGSYDFLTPAPSLTASFRFAISPFKIYSTYYPYLVSAGSFPAQLSP